MRFILFFQKGSFKIRQTLGAAIGFIRKLYYTSQGMKIGNRTKLPKIFTTWPHKVSIGSNCIIEQHVYFKFDGIWSPDFSIIIGNNVFLGANTEFNIRKKISIGNDCLIASGCRFIDHDHGIDSEHLMRQQACTEAEIRIEDNVWIGCNCVILKGVCIGKGAVIAAGAVVTKDVTSYSIAGGVPAKFLKKVIN